MTPAPTSFASIQAAQRLLPLLRHSCCITDPQRRAEKEGWHGECVEARDNQKTTSSTLHCSSQQMDETSALLQFGA
ncbi:hypothetical protein Q5P01_010070 [Channa striata]|uniref:Uncharacterized protein n=1 Tax=Channa striata TaxID=64152 RepID=A0AA88N055_CHASR|nr:hypothetical protein Q5P01_010070 [Channa striata]